VNNFLELLFQSLLLYLQHFQYLNSMLQKCEFKLKAAREKEGDDSSSIISKLEEKIVKVNKKIEDFNCAKYARDCSKLVKTLNVNSDTIKVGSKYAKELNQVIGQVVDVCRLFLLREQPKSKVDGNELLDMMLATEDQGAMTTASSTLNIMQV